MWDNLCAMNVARSFVVGQTFCPTTCWTQQCWNGIPRMWMYCCWKRGARAQQTLINDVGTFYRASNIVFQQCFAGFREFKFSGSRFSHWKEGKCNCLWVISFRMERSFRKLNIYHCKRWGSNACSIRKTFRSTWLSFYMGIFICIRACFFIRFRDSLLLVWYIKFALVFSLFWVSLSNDREMNCECTFPTFSRLLELFLAERRFRIYPTLTRLPG